MNGVSSVKKPALEIPQLHFQNPVKQKLKLVVVVIVVVMTLLADCVVTCRRSMVTQVVLSLLR